MSNRVVHFEIHADDPDRAINFYKYVFGWDIKKWEGGSMEYWMVMTDSTSSPQSAKEGSKELGINGGILRRKGPPPKKGQAVNSYVSTMQVDNFDDTAKKIEKAGGTVAFEKFAIPGMAWQGYFHDTEGNIFGIHEPNKKAT